MVQSVHKQKINFLQITFNFIIVVLLILISFMSYNVILKIQNFEKNNSITDNNQLLQVEVLNGCGLPGAADKITEFLRKKNIDVVQIGNFRSFDIDEMLVIDRKGNMAIAYKIADSLGVKRTNVIQQINKNYLLDATVVVGKNYKKILIKN